NDLLSCTPRSLGGRHLRHAGTAAYRARSAPAEPGSIELGVISTSVTKHRRRAMGVADERNVFCPGDSMDTGDIVMTSRRRRRFRRMETQFRFLSALVGKQQGVEARSAEGIPPDGDLRAALWLLRRSR